MNNLILVGLGNNDLKHKYNRHNVGTMLLDFIAKKNNCTWTSEIDCWWTNIDIFNKKIMLIKLKTWMNLSGLVLKKVLLKLKLDESQVIICTDNIDLSFNQVKLNRHLSSNGHKGIANIKTVFNNNKMPTLHLGVNKNIPVEKWVLSNFSETEKETLYKETFPTLAKNITNSYQISQDKNNFIKIFHQTQTWKSSNKKQFLAIVGGQWGDEGKGKVVDYFAAQNFQIVARFSGGDNAGHSIQIGEKKYQFSILPVSIIQPEVISVIGRGCVINLAKLLSEINILKQTQKIINLKISPLAHLILPYHILFDKLEEENRKKQIGTTKRGIGPCLQDKVGRFGLQVGDLWNKSHFKQKLQLILENKNTILQKIYHHEPLKLESVYNEQLKLFTQIKQYVADVWQLMQADENQKILFEGAQGTMLDINFGTYPFVTSTSTITWQIGNSFGNLCHKTEFMGVFKAYSTRVGAGPMWTELVEKDHAAKVNHIVIKGNEFGVVTKRKRRVGWFDAVYARYSCQINGFHKITLTMLDVLSGFEKIKICIGYSQNQQPIIGIPVKPNESKIDCEYLVVDGWQEDITQIKTYEQLPLNAKKYVEKIEQLLETPIVMLSVGPERSQIIQKPKSSLNGKRRKR